MATTTVLKKSEQATERDNHIAALRKKLSAPGVKANTVYTTVKHVSASGMSREISFYIAGKDGIECIDWYIKSILGYSFGKKGVKVSGCGMDMSFATVYNLSRVLFPKGFKVTGYGRNGDTSGWDKDGGYKLQQEWI